MLEKLPGSIQERAVLVLRELSDNPLLGKPLNAVIIHEGSLY